MSIPAPIEEVVSAFSGFVEEAHEELVLRDDGQPRDCTIKLTLPAAVSTFVALDILNERILEERDDVLFPEKSPDLATADDIRCSVGGIILSVKITPATSPKNLSPTTPIKGVTVTFAYHEARTHERNQAQRAEPVLA